MTQVTRWSPADAGCIIDGVHGRYGYTRVIEIARNNGFAVTPLDDAAITLYDRGEACSYDYIYDLADSAEKWLNEHCAPEGYHFHWHDGDFFLSNENEEY